MSYKINGLLCFSNKSDSNFILELFLKSGIASKIADSIDSAKEDLLNNKIDIFFLDFDFGDSRSFELLETINNNKKLSNIIIIGSSIYTDQNMIKNLKKYKIVAFFKKPFDLEAVQYKLGLIFNKFKNHFSERKHVRITPNEDELMRVNFKLRNNKRISAKVIDISLGGVGVEMYSDIESPELDQGNFIEHLTFEAENKLVDTDAKIVKRENRFLGFQFTHFYKNSYDHILRYISKNLTK